MTYSELRQELRNFGVDTDTAEHYLVWLKLNTAIWKAFETKTLNLIQNGIKHYGAKAICEALRYDWTLQGCGEFKLCNNYPAYLARTFAIKHPNHKTFFEYRETTGLKAAA